ncbi:hypothetical protein K438DRAFT_634303 [Mycena galopus ATCC 62051]|nr:hypothetical protein K438DRAFT_634303 [Mycena galopus ATCC 62051]
MESAIPPSPLTPHASRQIFLDIADVPTTEEESALDTLLDLSGRLPLAVSLMSNIASFGGYSNTLSRWQNENTTLLSDGHNKRSNLEKLIMLSLSSPRMSSFPQAMNFLSLFSLLPDGIRAEDIMTSKVRIFVDGNRCWSAPRWQTWMSRTSQGINSHSRVHPVPSSWHVFRSPSHLFPESYRTPGVET